MSASTQQTQFCAFRATQVAARHYYRLPMHDPEPAERPLDDVQRPDSPAPGSPMPSYKGEPLDGERGPGLGCFWAQVIVLSVLLVLTPLSVVLGAEPWLSGLLLIVVLILLLFVGQTAIFLLRLVAADRRTRRRPLAGGARKTVGQLEDEEEREEREERS